MTDRAEIDLCVTVFLLLNDAPGRDLEALRRALAAMPEEPGPPARILRDAVIEFLAAETPGDPGSRAALKQDFRAYLSDGIARLAPGERRIGWGYEHDAGLMG